MTCKLCRQTRQRCFSYICNSQVVKSNRVNDQNRAETCLLKADCGDCVAITAIALNAAIQERPMTHLQVLALFLCIASLFPVNCSMKLLSVSIAFDRKLPRFIPARIA